MGGQDRLDGVRAGAGDGAGGRGASTAWSATGGNFLLGKANTANTADRVSKLAASVAGPALTLVNRSTEAAATALNINVDAGNPPLKVNAEAGTAANLSADELDGKDSGEFLAADGKAADSNALDGKDSTQFADAAHAHSGADITSGTVAEARIDGAVARDSEVMPTVKANDGAGSGLDADMLDGQNSTAFVKQGEVKHAVVDYTGTIYPPASTPGTTASRSATGTYRVAFPNTNAAQCTYAFGIEYNSFGFIRMDVPATSATSITVYTADTSGTLADRSFDVIARCPSAGATSLAASSQSKQEASGVRAR